MMSRVHILFVCGQIIACYAPFFWAAYQIHALHDPAICVPVSTPLRTSVGDETVLYFHTPESSHYFTIWDIQVASRNLSGDAKRRFAEKGLPLRYKVFCNGQKVALRDKATWPSSGSRGDDQLTLYCDVSVRLKPDQFYTICVYPKESLDAYPLDQPQLRVYSFDRFYGYALPLTVQFTLLGFISFVIGTTLFSRRLKRFRP